MEYRDAANRRAVYVAQRKNLRIARFLNRVVFCLFAEDTGLLPANIFSEVTRTGLDDPQLFAGALEDLFRAMAKGGRFGRHKIRHFNGHLFEEATVFELTADELRQLADAAEADWQFIEPSIMGTLFERALEPEQRSQLGAHYTSEPDIKTLVEPVLMAPLRREWAEIKAQLVPTIGTKKAAAKAILAQGERLAAFQDKLAAVTVLDPACGSGNFLYVSLQLLLGLEKEVIAQAEQLGHRLAGPKVSVQQLRAIEINAYAFELAQVAVQIGYLQWRRDNGFDNERTPVLQNLDGFENKDALLNETFRKKPKNLQAARAEEHGGQDELFKVYTERMWPSADVIVGNPPFLGGKMLRRELGSDYVDALFEVYRGAVPHEADLCCYWFEKARGQIVGERSRRAGLLATQGIRGGANRRVLEAIKQSGDIFFAESDRKWTLNGAAVQVSMVGFDDGSQPAPHVLDGAKVPHIYANLSSAGSDVTTARLLPENAALAFMGDTKGGAFDLSAEVAAGMLVAGPNPNGRPNSDVVRPWINGLDVSRVPQGKWIIDFPPSTEEAAAALYEAPFEYLRKHVRPERVKNRRASYAERWWLHVEPRPEMRAELEGLPRFIVTLTLSKHRLFAWVEHPTLPDHQLIAFARADDFFFGVLHSRFHEVWALARGTQLENRPRYTPTTCFETFPFPWMVRTAPDALAPEQRKQHDSIALAARELDTKRRNWLGDRSDAKRTLTNLYNARPAWLADAHQQLDSAVAAAYGWPVDLIEAEILARLLALNLTRAANVSTHPAPKRKVGKLSNRGKAADDLL